MFAFVWTYSLFPLLLFNGFGRSLSRGTSGDSNGGRSHIRRPVWSRAISSIRISRRICSSFFEHFWTKFKVGSDFAVAVGGEWYPYTGMELLMNFPVALGAVLIGYILFVPRRGKVPEKAAFFLAFVTILLAAQFRSKRFAEVFPFAIAFAAFCMDGIYGACGGENCR